MNKLAGILFLLLFFSCSVALPNSKIFGTVTDSTTNQPLPYVNIFLLNTTIGCVSDTSGYFELNNLPDGQYILVFQRIGYKQSKHSIQLKNNSVLKLNIKMSANIVNADNITIEDKRWNSPFADFFQGDYKLTRMQIVNQPGAFEDPLRALQSVTGVINQSDYTSNMYIRGSRPNEQAVILDGVLLQNPYRLRMAGYGGISIINPDIIDSLRVSLGGFPASYGNRLGGLIEINTTNGKKKWTNHLSLDLVSTRYFLSGPLWQNAKFVFSLRKTYYDFLLKKLTSSKSSYPFFTDAFGKFVWQIAPQLTFKFAIISGNEGSNLLNNKLFSGKVYSRSQNLIVYGNVSGFLSKDLNYKIAIAKQYNVDSLNASSSMVDYYRSYRIKSSRASITSRIEWDTNSWLSIALGAEAFSTRKIWSQAEAIHESSPDHRGANAYINNLIKINKNMRLKAGLRSDYSNVNHQLTYDPRFSFYWKLAPELDCGLAYGIYHQSPQIIDFNNHGSPLLPDSVISKFRTPVVHYLGLKIGFKPFENFSVRLETYLKRGFYLRSWMNADSAMVISGDKGRDEAQGIELNLIYFAKNWETHLGYVYSVALNKGMGSSEWQYKEFDNRHWFNYSLSYRLNQNFLFSTFLKASSGFRININTGWYKIDEQTWALLPSSFYKRFPYFRWDARFTYRQKHWSAYLELINITNKKNFYQELCSVTSNGKRTILKSYVTYMLPRLPIAGLTFTF